MNKTNKLLIALLGIALVLVTGCEDKIEVQPKKVPFTLPSGEVVMAPLVDRPANYAPPVAEPCLPGSPAGKCCWESGVGISCY